jgi:hypothetical protein
MQSAAFAGANGRVASPTLHQLDKLVLALCTKSSPAVTAVSHERDGGGSRSGWAQSPSRSRAAAASKTESRRIEPIGMYPNPLGPRALRSAAGESSACLRSNSVVMPAGLHFARERLSPPRAVPASIATSHQRHRAFRDVQAWTSSRGRRSRPFPCLSRIHHPRSRSSRGAARSRHSGANRPVPPTAESGDTRCPA